MLTTSCLLVEMCGNSHQDSNSIYILDNLFNGHEVFSICDTQQKSLNVHHPQNTLDDLATFNVEALHDLSKWNPVSFFH